MSTLLAIWLRPSWADCGRPAAPASHTSVSLLNNLYSFVHEGISSSFSGASSKLLVDNNCHTRAACPGFACKCLLVKSMVTSKRLPWMTFARPAPAWGAFARFDDAARAKRPRLPMMGGVVWRCGCNGNGTLGEQEAPAKYAAGQHVLAIIATSLAT